MRSALIAAAIVLLAACHDSTAPKPWQPARVYVLDAVSGRPLPDTIATAFDTTITLSGSLTLDQSGHAIEVMRQRYTYIGYAGEERDFAQQMSYRIQGDSITVGWFGPCIDLCVPNLVGELTDTTVTLTYQYDPPTAPIYHYRRIPGG